MKHCHPFPPSDLSSAPFRTIALLRQEKRFGVKSLSHAKKKKKVLSGQLFRISRKETTTDCLLYAESNPVRQPYTKKKKKRIMRRGTNESQQVDGRWYYHGNGSVLQSETAFCSSVWLHGVHQPTGTCLYRYTWQQIKPFHPISKTPKGR